MYDLLEQLALTILMLAVVAVPLLVGVYLHWCSRPACPYCHRKLLDSRCWPGGSFCPRCRLKFEGA